MDIVKCYEKSHSFTRCSEKCEIEDPHLNWFKEAEKIAKPVGTARTKLRVVATQVYPTNLSLTSVSHYHRTFVTVPFLDYLAGQTQFVAPKEIRRCSMDFPLFHRICSQTLDGRRNSRNIFSS